MQNIVAVVLNNLRCEKLEPTLTIVLFGVKTGGR
jgi:hypothetical protein